MSYPVHNPPASPYPVAPTTVGVLTPADVREFQQIMREECGVTLDDAEAWTRARELANLYRILLRPLPEDPSTPVPTDGSNIVALALPATGKVR